MCIVTILGSNFSKANDHYPPKPSLEEILKFVDNKSVPFINNKNYLRELQSYAGLEVIDRVLIIIGPKDSGKSEGLSLISKAWRNNGHLVLDINFEGNKKASGQSMMPYISYEFMRMLSSLSFKSYKDLFEIIFTDCAIKAEESNLEILIKWMITHYNFIVMIITTLTGLLTIYIIPIFRKYFSFCYNNINGIPTIIPIFRKYFSFCYNNNINGIPTIIPIFRKYFSFCYNNGSLTIISIFRKYYKCLVLTPFAMLLFAIPLYFVWVNPIALIEYMKPIDLTITGGDWQALVCYLNKLTLIKPENRPILVIRELNRMDDETLLECLSALEKVKQKKILFPVILETSDSKWDMVPAVKKSCFSFSMYYIAEMTYNEGLTEIVHRLKFFKEKDYDTIYKTIGGHLGSYYTLLSHTKKYSLDQALEEMRRFTYVHLRSCIRQSEKNITDTIAALEMLNRTTITLTAEEMTIYNYLLDCNVLFRDKYDRLMPQNQLMRDAIIKVLAEK